MKREDWTKSPSVMRNSGKFVGGTMRVMGSRFLSARRVPVLSTRKPKNARGKTNLSFCSVQGPIFLFTQGEEIGVALQQIGKGVGALGMVVEV